MTATATGNPHEERLAAARAAYTRLTTEASEADHILRTSQDVGKLAKVARRVEALPVELQAAQLELLRAEQAHAEAEHEQARFLASRLRRGEEGGLLAAQQAVKDAETRLLAAQRVAANADVRSRTLSHRAQTLKVQADQLERELRGGGNTRRRAA